MTPKRRRLTILLLAALGLGTATALTLTAFQDNLVFFRSPADIAAEPPPPGRNFRLGGLVEQGSVERGTTAEGRPNITFNVTDGAHTVRVQYSGVVPDLFREGQGVVTLGQIGPDGVFHAREVLARHDENYMPPEVADALRRSGHWNPASGDPPPAAGWNRLQPAQASERSSGG